MNGVEYGQTTSVDGPGADGVQCDNNRVVVADLQDRELEMYNFQRQQLQDNSTNSFCLLTTVHHHHSV